MVVDIVEAVLQRQVLRLMRMGFTEQEARRLVVLKLRVSRHPELFI